MNTTSSPLLVIDIKVAKTDTSFLAQCIYLQNGLFLAIVASHLTGIAKSLFLLALNSIDFYNQDRVFFLFEPLPFLILVIRLDGLIDAK